LAERWPLRGVRELDNSRIESILSRERSPGARRVEKSLKRENPVLERDGLAGDSKHT
jgi:hypothetical protein